MKRSVKLYAREEKLDFQRCSKQGESGGMHRDQALGSRKCHFLCFPTLRVSSPGPSGARAGKGRRACNYVSGIGISALKKSTRNAHWRK